MLGTSLKGNVRRGPGVWDVLCLGLCAISGCLPFPILHGPSRKCQSLSLGIEHSLSDWCWEVIRVWVPPSRERCPPACLVCSGCDLGETALRSLLPLSLSGSAASHPRWSQLLPPPLSDFVPACRGRSIHRGRASQVQVPNSVPKALKCGAGPSLSGLDSIFPRINFPSEFVESVFLLSQF